MSEQVFTAVLKLDADGRVFVTLPFDPDEVWGTKGVHRVAGSLSVARDGVLSTLRIRASVDPADRRLRLHESWLRHTGLQAGHEVESVLHAEGPQRADLADDLAAALEATPEAGRFFDDLAQFYRKAYLRYIDATKRRPEVRAERIAEVVDLLAQGVKQRPKA